MISMIDHGDTAYVMFCTTLVLLMTPALALFYGGMVKRDDVLPVMGQTFIALGIVALIWVFGGFSLVFGADIGSFIGNPLTYFAMTNVGYAPNPDYGSTIPFLVFFSYQMMFAIIAPGLVVGAFVGRFRAIPHIWFVVLWTLLIYIPVAHWIWGGGFLQQLGAVDFAGGIVIHVTAGFSALVTAKMLGARTPKERKQPASNLPIVAVGTGLLWFGWFGFNSGGALGINEVAVYAFVNTTLAGSTALLIWILLEWRLEGKPSLTGLMVGAVAGLATITPAAGYVTPLSAILIGACGALICYSAKVVQKMLKIDDALEVFRAHGVGGMVGAILLGLLARESIDGVAASSHQFFIQIFAVVLVAIYTIVMTWLIVKIVQKANKEVLQLHLDK